MIAITFLFVCVLYDWFKSRRWLEAELLVLRHQLNVLIQRAPRRLHFRATERALFTWLYFLTPNHRQARHCCALASKQNFVAQNMPITFSERCEVESMPKKEMVKWQR